MNLRTWPVRRSDEVEVQLRVEDRHARMAHVLGVPLTRLQDLFQEHPALRQTEERKLMSRLLRLAEVLKVPMQQVRGRRNGEIPLSSTGTRA